METKYDDTLITVQCRMTRAGLGLSVTKASLVSHATTITRFQIGTGIKPVLLYTLRAALKQLRAIITDSRVEIDQSWEGEGA